MWTTIAVLIVLYYKIWKGRSWQERRDFTLVCVLALTVVIVPFHVQGVYMLRGIDDGGMEWNTGAYYLDPLEVYTSPRLSNIYAAKSMWGRVIFTQEQSNVTIFVSDENDPDVRYREITVSHGEEFLLWLPYVYYDFATPARWAFTLFNPNQNESIEFLLSVMIFPRPLDPRVRCLQPTIAIIMLWTGWGILMSATYVSMHKKPKLKTEHVHHQEEVEEDDWTGDERYRGVRDRKID
jgi:hypothetical protein